MALFSSKKNTKAKAPKKAEVAVVSSNSGVRGDVSHVLKNPRITEKASVHQNIGVYTFDVAHSATKTQIMQAVRETYKVSPAKVRIVQIPSKTTRNMRTGRYGVKSGGKKAYVYLKNGETITIS
ncbi:MAG TPA: 50S ribosomal protein L23 [Candidatus Paceibacterota bacterium]|nr:50S ribosomal protein L23 [Candidatus Paceibacterota bacterium]